MKQVDCKLLSGILALCGLMIATPAHAQFTIDFDAVIDFDIGYANVDIVDSPTPPTHVSLVNGGIMYAVNAYGVTEFTMTGGTLGSLFLFNNSRADITGGQFTNVLLYGNSRATVTNSNPALIRASTEGTSEASFSLSDATQVYVRAYGYSKFTLSGGHIRKGADHGLHVFNNASCVVNYTNCNGGGYEHMTAEGSSHLTIHSGYYETTSLEGWDQSVVCLTGGHFEYPVFALNSATLYVQGGSSTALDVYHNAVVHVSGGSFGTGSTGITLRNSGVMHVYGNNLTYNAFRRLQGTLLNGTAINKVIAITDPTTANPPRVVLHNYPVLSTTLSGTIALEDCTNSAQSVTFVFGQGNSCLPYEKTVTLDSSGGYTLPNVPGDVYEVRIKSAKWLAKKQALNINAATLTLNTGLLAGDANNDNSVDVLDLDLLIQAFDSASGDVNWNEGADFNCDDSVDVLDLDLLIRNFDSSGDS